MPTEEAERKAKQLEEKYTLDDHDEAFQVGNWLEINGTRYRVNIPHMKRGGKDLTIDGDPVQTRRTVGIGGGIDWR